MSVSSRTQRRGTLPRVESAEKPELAAVLHALDEQFRHLRIILLVIEELRVKLDETLAPDQPDEKTHFD
jgi:hypothetical protein